MIGYPYSRKPCSANKLKEITGSGIFEAESENGTLESDANPTPNSKTGLRMYQVCCKSLLFSRWINIGS